MLHLKDVHDGEELSCMALDGLGERLITGARDGSTNVSKFLPYPCRSVFVGFHC